MDEPKHGRTTILGRGYIAPRTFRPPLSVLLYSVLVLVLEG